MVQRVVCHRCNYIRDYKGNKYKIVCNNCGTTITIKRLDLDQVKKEAEIKNKERGFI